MFRWTDKPPKGVEYSTPFFQQYITDYLKAEQDKVEAEIRATMSRGDLWLTERWLDGRLNVTEEELRDMYQYQYESVYMGGKFLYVRKSEKTKDENDG